MQKEKINSLKDAYIRASTERKSLEKELLKLKRLERLQLEEYEELKTEIEGQDEKIQDIKVKALTMESKLVQLGIWKVSEEAKLNAKKKIIEQHRHSYEKYFEKERKAAQQKYSKIREKELEEQEMKRTVASEQIRKNEVKLKKVESIEAYCSKLEQECAVLKKRNAAVLLVLRRSLFEAANIQKRMLAQQQSAASANE